MSQRAPSRAKVQNLAAAQRELSKLRGFRVWNGPDLSICGEIAKTVGSLLRNASTAGSIEKAFDELCPANLKGRVVVTAWTRGVLTLRASDHAARYDADRWLSGAGLKQLAKRSGKGITRVRFAAR